MAYDCGWAALNLEMPERVPRTEYSAAEYHWPLVERVTGIRIGKDSTPEERFRATAAFRRAWTYDFNWNVLINTQVYGGLYTRMGHAAYDGEGRDFDDRISCPFEDVEEVLNFDPFEAFGKVDGAEATRRFEEHYRASKAAFPDEVNMTGVYTTLMSGLIAVFGWDMLLLACGEDSRAFGKMTDRYAQWMQQYMNALAEADVAAGMVQKIYIPQLQAVLRAHHREREEAGVYLRRELYGVSGRSGGHGGTRVRAGAHDGYEGDRGEVWKDPRLYWERRHEDTAEWYAGGHTGGGEAVHGHRKGMPGVFHGRGQSYPRQYAGGKLFDI